MVYLGCGKALARISPKKLEGEGYICTFAPRLQNPVLLTSIPGPGRPIAYKCSIPRLPDLILVSSPFTSDASVVKKYGIHTE